MLCLHITAMLEILPQKLARQEILPRRRQDPATLMYKFQSQQANLADINP